MMTRWVAAPRFSASLNALSIFGECFFAPVCAIAAVAGTTSPNAVSPTKKRCRTLITVKHQSNLAGHG